MTPTRTTHPARIAGIIATAGAALLLFGACSGGGSPTPAGTGEGSASTGTTDPPQAEDVATCTSAGKVWLVAAAENGTRLADQCVGTPATGTAALEAAGLDVVRDANGLICAIGGEPAQCPATFDGRFWQYYSATPGGEWQFATTGSDEAVPAAGSIEGWCYGEACTPPETGGVSAPASAG